ncbi:MAG: hypothetical protein QME68_00675 [Elusimicrobiota bacterium]|nr:hypothetical protein [Elusimicrobiota bacterium]
MQKVIAPPGETVKGNIWVINTEDKKLEVEIQPEDWSKDRKSGINWLKIKPKKFTLKPKKMKEIKWKTIIPKNAEGDLVAQIFFASIGSRLGAVNIGTRIAYGLYITVKGTEKSNAEITKFYVKHDKNKYGFAVVLKNTGNVHLTTRGEIILSDLQNGTTRQLELKPWFYRSGESFTLWSWLLEPLQIGDYKSTATIFYTDPSGYEQKIDSKIDFSVNDDGEIVEKR